MAGNKSAEKRHRQNLKRRLNNKQAKSTIRTAKKRFYDAIKSEDKALAENEYKTVVKLIDTAAGKGVYHKNNAARKKSRMHSALKTMD